jgi:hypothetical protein
MHPRTRRLLCIFRQKWRYHGSPFLFARFSPLRLFFFVP